MGNHQARVEGIDTLSSLHYLDDSRHVMLRRSMKKNNGLRSPYLARNQYPTAESSFNKMISSSLSTQMQPLHKQGIGSPYFKIYFWQSLDLMIIVCVASHQSRPFMFLGTYQVILLWIDSLH